MRSTCLVILLATAGTARAEPETHWEFSMPFVIGALDDDRWHGFEAWHPEAIRARSEDDQGWGIGPFLDLSGTFDDPMEGRAAAGLTYVLYGAHARSVAFSGGVSTSGHGAVPFVGLFAGFRPLWDFPLDVPTGFRFDLRPGRDMIPTTVSIAFEIDALPDLYIFVELIRAMGNID